MMNDTVARIVEIMFQDTVMTEEVSAIRDEVMNNCQERYEDMLSRGVSEDDAVAAVIESLKGMEEVIGQYPKKGVPVQDAPDATDEDSNVEAQREFIYHHGSVQKIDLTLVNEDVKIECSDDSHVHVTLEGDDPRAVAVKMHGSKLTIERTPDYQRVIKEDQIFTTRMGADGMEVEGVHIEMEQISGLESIGRVLGNVFKRLKVRVQNESAVDSVTIAIPTGWQGDMNLMTTSGDIELSDVGCRDLRAVTTNGDINVSTGADDRLLKVELISTSGDLNVNIFADFTNLRTTSGDIELEGRCKTLNVSTISGDLEVRADVVDCTFKAISGDVDLEFDSDELRSVNGTTISGDVDVDLPDGIGRVAINTHTISGDVTTRCSTNGYGPCVAGSISTTSGNIDIR